MRRFFAALAGLLACACAPAPAPMAASAASEHLERFAAGSVEDVCTPHGRALLRGAVRAYGAELARAGVSWPAFPESDGQGLHNVDAAVAIAYAAGFIEGSDLQGQARRTVSRMALMHWPQITDMRAAARVACGRVLDLQKAALRLVSEMKRTQLMAARAQTGPDANAERLRRQRERLENAQAQLDALAQAIRREIAATRRR